ncbi:MAG: hypothetical protein LBG21_00060 [Campylobacteraceae bacterium]|nr:hypothetical protein [Campylobacteraceae bacterium]
MDFWKILGVVVAIIAALSPIIIFLINNRSLKIIDNKKNICVIIKIKDITGYRAIAAQKLRLKTNLPDKTNILIAVPDGQTAEGYFKRIKLGKEPKVYKSKPIYRSN